MVTLLSDLAWAEADNTKTVKRKSVRKEKNGGLSVWKIFSMAGTLWYQNCSKFVVIGNEFNGTVSVCFCQLCFADGAKAKTRCDFRIHSGLEKQRSF